jgi:hypothetical protein
MARHIYASRRKGESAVTAETTGQDQKNSAVPDSEAQHLEPPRSGAYSGYHRIATPGEDKELTHVLRWTPGGEYLRRFWQPVALASQVGDTPLNVKVLGEELVLFRSRKGNLGLLAQTLSASESLARIRTDRRSGHSLLLSRLALRHRRSRSRNAG